MEIIRLFEKYESKCKCCVRSQTVSLSNQWLCHFVLCYIMSRLKVSDVNGTLKHFTETGSDVSKARSGRATVSSPSEHQYIQLSSLRDIEAAFITDTECTK